MNGSYQITVLSTSRAFSLLWGKKLGQVTSNGIEQSVRAFSCLILFCNFLLGCMCDRHKRNRDISNCLIPYIVMTLVQNLWKVFLLKRLRSPIGLHDKPQVWQ